MAGGLKLSQLETIVKMKDSDLMLVDSTIGTGKITIGDLKTYFNITEMQKDVDDINDSFVNITTSLNKALEDINTLEREDTTLLQLINNLTNRVDTNQESITNLGKQKQNKTDKELATESKEIVGAINEIYNFSAELNKNKQSTTDNKLTTDDKTIVGSINEVKSSIPKIVNNLTDGGYDKTLSAQQGVVLNETDTKINGYIDDISINVKKLGAHGDNAPRKIKETDGDITLEDVKALNPQATLDDEYDWYIIQKAVKDNRKIYIPEGNYVISKPIIISEDYTELSFHRKACLVVKNGDIAISAIQVGESLESSSPRKASNCIITNPRVLGNGNGTGIECRWCGMNNVIERPFVTNCERGIHFSVKYGFIYGIIREASLRNNTIGFDDSEGGFNNSILEGGIIELNSNIGLRSAGAGCQVVGVTIAGNKGTEIKPMGNNCQISFVSCTIHHNNEDEAENNTKTVFLFDNNWKGVLNLTNTIVTEAGNGILFKEGSAAIASADIYVNGGSFSVKQLFSTANSASFRVLLNNKYNMNTDMDPIRKGVHENAVIQLSDSQGEFASIHTKSFNLEPLDSQTNSAAIKFTCSNYVPWSVGNTGVGLLKGSIHIDVSTSIVYIRKLAPVGTDNQNNWAIIFNGV